MPDAQGNYHGDEANVITDNSANYIHFVDKFAELQQQKQLQKARDAKTEQERQGRIDEGINKDIYNPNYLKNDATNPMIQDNMDVYAKKTKEIYHTQGESAAKQYSQQAAMNLAAGSEKIAETNKNIIDAVARHQSQNPDFDGPAAVNLAHTEAWFKKDQNGNLVHKGLNEINPSLPYLQNALNGEHAPDFYNEKASSNSLNATLGKETINEVKQGAIYNENGTLKQRGLDGKMPTSITHIEDENGVSKVKLNSENYKLNGTDHDFVDDKGQTIKVLPSNTYDNYFNANPGAKAKVDRQVRDIISKPIATPNGLVTFDKDSDYAHMLTQKFAYENLNEHIKDRYNVNSVDESAKMIKEYKNQNRADAKLNLAEHSSALADKKFDKLLHDSEEKKAGAAAPPIGNFLGAVNEKYGKDLDNVQITPGKSSTFHLFKPNEPAVSAEVGNVRIIPTTADPKDLNIVSPLVKGKRSVPPISFKNADGNPILGEDGSPVKGWIYHPETGNASGEKGVVIDKYATQREYVNHNKKASLNIKLTTSQTPVKAIKVKGTDKKMF